MSDRIGVTIRLDPEDHRRFRLAAADQRKSQGALARSIIRDYLDQLQASDTSSPEIPAPSTRKGTRNPNTSKKRKKR